MVILESVIMSLRASRFRFRVVQIFSFCIFGSRITSKSRAQNLQSEISGANRQLQLLFAAREVHDARSTIKRESVQSPESRCCLAPFSDTHSTCLATTYHNLGETS
jgi:hypothetical protein